MIINVSTMQRLLKIISPFLYLLTHLFLKNSKKICFGGWFGEKYTDSSKYIFEYASKESEYEVIWICKSEELVTHIRSEGFNAFHAYTLHGLYHQLTAKTFICNVSSRDFCAFCISKLSYLVQLGHGMPLKSAFSDRLSTFGVLKKIIRDRTIDSYKLVAISSPFFLDVIKYQYRKDLSGIIEIPEARCDGLAVDVESLNLLDEKYDLESCTKVALYMPTHRSEGKSIEVVKSALVDLDLLAAELPGLKILVNFHFYDRTLAKSLDKYANITLITEDVDTAPLMARSDLLIGDYSGVIFDYLYLDKPTVAYVPDFENYLSQIRGLYFDLNDIYTFVCPEVKSLRKSIVRIMTDDILELNNINIYGSSAAPGGLSGIAFKSIVDRLQL